VLRSARNDHAGGAEVGAVIQLGCARACQAAAFARGPVVREAGGKKRPFASRRGSRFEVAGSRRRTVWRLGRCCSRLASVRLGPFARQDAFEARRFGAAVGSAHGAYTPRRVRAGGHAETPFRSAWHRRPRSRRDRPQELTRAGESILPQSARLRRGPHDAKPAGRGQRRVTAMPADAVGRPACGDVHDESANCCKGRIDDRCAVPASRDSERSRSALVLVLGPGPRYRSRAPCSQLRGGAAQVASRKPAQIQTTRRCFGGTAYPTRSAAFLASDAIEPSAAMSFNIARRSSTSTTLRRPCVVSGIPAPREQAPRTAVGGGASVAALADALAERGVQQLTVIHAERGLR